MTVKPTKAPCKSCPYRKDAPRGLWARNEYEKLPEYDAPTWAQPPGLFMCHSEPENLCGGWVGCHGGELLALRFAGSTGEVDASTFDYVSPVPLFASGTDAALHGLSGIDEPDEKARRMLPRLKKKIRKRKRK